MKLNNHMQLLSVRNTGKCINACKKMITIIEQKYLKPHQSDIGLKHIHKRLTFRKKTTNQSASSWCNDSFYHAWVDIPPTLIYTYKYICKLNLKAMSFSLYHSLFVCLSTNLIHFIS